MNIHRQLGVATNSGAKSMEKLSSGLRINRAGDDAAGLSISEKMRGQIRGLNQASKNAQDGISMIQTAEGALNETHAILQRMRELSVQSSTDTNTADDRAKIQSEVDQLSKEITRISNTTEFNTQNLMAGGLSNKFHIGANEGQNVSMSINAMDSKSLGVAGDLVSYGLDGADTGVTGVVNASKDLTGYTINTSVQVAAAQKGVTVMSNGAIGALAIAAATTYSGSKDQAFTIRIDSINTAGTLDRISTASLSRDGGTTWENLALTASGDDATATVDGLAITLAGAGDSTAGVPVAGNAVGETWAFSMTAEYKSVQLQDSSANGVGEVVKVYNNMSKATIGGGDATANISFTYAGLLGTVQSDTITSVKTESKAATLAAGGGINGEAVTYKGIDVSSQAAADKATTKINDAITSVSEERSKLGALQNRLEHTIKNLDTSSENLQASESRIRDVDMAKEMMEQTKNNILQQASTAMLAQANTQPQGVLQLLR